MAKTYTKKDYEAAGSPADLVIPEGFTEIGPKTFMNVEFMLKSVVFPSSITEIPERLFIGCEALESVVLPETLKSIGSEAFYGCSSLQSMNIPAGVDSINRETFKSCTSLQAIKLPEGLEYIGGEAFAECKALTSINLPDSLESISEDAFVNSGLVASTIENTSYAIKDGLFINKKRASLLCALKSFDEIVIPEGIEEIARHAFYMHQNLKKISLPEGLKTIGQSAFYNCKALEEVVIPDSVTKIRERAFVTCSSLKTLTLGSGLEYIEDSAFAECLALEKVIIKNPATKYGLTPFKMCKAIAEVELPKGLTWGKIKAKFKDSPWGQTAPTPQKTQQTEKTAAKKAKLEAFNAMVLDASLSEWKHSIEKDGGMAVVRVDFANGHTILGRYQLKGKFDVQGFIDLCRQEATSTDVPTLRITAWKKSIQGTELNLSGYSKLILPAGIETIDSNAFAKKDIIEILLPDTLTAIGDYAFYGCENLSTIKLPTSLTSIGNGAFGHCHGLKSIELPDNTESIAWNAFFESGLIGETVENKKYSIKDGLFIDKANKVLLQVLLPQEEIVIPEGILKIGEMALSQYVDKYSGTKVVKDENPKEIKRVVLPDGLETISDGAFYWSKDLESVNIPDSVRIIESEAFCRCESLNDIKLSPGLTNIGRKAFSNCGSLKSVEIPGSVSVISVEAFCECTGLTEVILHEGTTEISYGAFAECVGITSIAIPASVQNISPMDKKFNMKGAFQNCTTLKEVTLPESAILGPDSFKGTPWRKSAAAKPFFTKK